MANTIPTAAIPTPLPVHPFHLPFVEAPGSGSGVGGWSGGSGSPDNGAFGTLAPTALQQQTALIGQVNGTGRHIPAINTGGTANAIALTLAGTGGPTIQGYKFGDVYSFVAGANSTGNVTATVNPQVGTLPALKVFKNNGAAQATNGDIVSGLHYVLHYVPTLDSGNGGFVLR